MHIIDTALGTVPGAYMQTVQTKECLLKLLRAPSVAQARPVLTGTRPFTWLEDPLHSAIWAAACEDVRPPLLGAAERDTPLLPGDDSNEPPPDHPADTLTLPVERQEDACSGQLDSISPSAWQTCHPAQSALGQLWAAGLEVQVSGDSSIHATNSEHSTNSEHITLLQQRHTGLLAGGHGRKRRVGAMRCILEGRACCDISSVDVRAEFNQHFHRVYEAAACCKMQWGVVRVVWGVHRAAGLK